MTSISIPSFPFTGQYYPEFLEDIIQYMRVNAPELSDEDPAEPHIQLIRAFALGMHYMSCLLDLVSNEMFLPTAKLRGSHDALLRLIDVRLAQATPATVDLVAKLTATFSAAQEIIPAGSVFGTLETRAVQSIDYEALDAVDTLLATDAVGYVYAYRDDTQAYTDHSTEAQSALGAFTPTWSAAIENNDALYIGHPGVLWDMIRLDIAVGAVGLTTGVWEYYDGNYDQGQPSSVTNLGGTLRFNVNSILGIATRVGTTVRVRSALTGAYQDLTVTFVGGENRITTAGADAFLGQAAPSVLASDYIVGAAWQELEGLTDGSTGWTVVGTEDDVEYTLPQSLLQNWRKTTVGSGVLAVEAYWIRYRVIVAGGGATAPSVNQVRIHDGAQYVLFTTTQGQSREENPLGSSDGSADQQFTLSNSPVIDDDILSITVDEGSGAVAYTRTDNFLTSVGTDRHFTVDFQDDGTALITFGNGTNGRIPPAGVDNIVAVYRTMVDLDGNVGRATVTVNRNGVAYLASVTNPRSASGYRPREGSTDEDLARLKIAGPASLRARGRAVSTGDVETVAREFTSDDGAKPVERTLAVEEAFGVKTVEVIVVGAGGGQVAAAKLSEIQDYFNGTETVRGRIVMNHQATVTNFTPQTVDITATVTGGNLTSILTALTALLNPLAKDEDGNWIWQFGGDVHLAKLYQTIMNTSPPPTNVVFATPVADVALGARSLPTVGTLTITVA